MPTYRSALYIYIYYLQRESIVLRFLGEFVKRRQFFLKLFLNGTLEHWNVSLVALAALRFDLFLHLFQSLVTCHSVKNSRSNPFDRLTLAYLDALLQSLLKKTGIK